MTDYGFLYGRMITNERFFSPNMSLLDEMSLLNEMFHQFCRVQQVLERCDRTIYICVIVQ